MDRSWMYDRLNSRRSGLKASFCHGVDDFIRTSKRHKSYRTEGGIRCPCAKCQLMAVLTPDEVKVHLEKKGFQPNNFIWTAHGEVGQNANVFVDPGDRGVGPSTNAGSSRGDEQPQQLHHVQGLIFDATGVNITYEEPQGDEPEEFPNESAQEFCTLLSETNKPLWEGSSESKLTICIRLMGMKSTHNVSEQYLDSRFHTRHSIIVKVLSFSIAIGLMKQPPAQG